LPFLLFGAIFVAGDVMPKLLLPELFTALRVNPKSRSVFLGLFLFWIAAVVVLARLHVLRFSQAWPVLVALCGVSLFVAGLYHRKKPGLSYLVPAILLVGLGVLFLLFSFHIIPHPLGWYVTQFWPFILAAAVAVLLALFFTRKKVAPIVAAVTDESGDDETDYP
jgi:hypothetical protein